MTVQSLANKPFIPSTTQMNSTHSLQQCVVEDLKVDASPSTSYFTGAVAMASGSAMTLFSLLGATATTPDIELLSLSKGDKLDIDGISTMNGTATIHTLNDDALELSFDLNIPGLVRGLADDHFSLKNGRVNLSLKVNRKGDDFSYQLVDNHSGNRKGSGDTEVSISNSSFKRSGLFGYNSRTVKSQDVTISVRGGDIKISIEDDPQGGVTGKITLPMLPAGAQTFDFTKK